MRRRDFLEGIGLTTIFWGLGQNQQTATASLVAKLSDDWQSAPTAQKFALLIGVNRYSQPEIPELAGCVTDLEMQSKLLRYRYGFAEENIFKLADQEATGENLRSTQAELTKRIQAGDVLVGHFSGYGMESIDGNALVLFDEILPLTSWENWLRSLPTPYLTTILDTSFTPAPASSLTILQSRSLPSSIAQSISQSLPDLPSTPISTPPSPNNPDLILTQRKPPVLIPKSPAKSFLDSPPKSLAISLDIPPALPGIVIRAAAIEQLAMEKSWDGFSAGLFTYTFTQTLWQTTSSQNPQNSQNLTNLPDNLDRAKKNLEAAIPGGETHQAPTISGKLSSVPFLVPQEENSPAVGLVIEREENNEAATLWLGGLPSQVLAHYGVDSLLRSSPEVSGSDLDSSEVNGLDSQANSVPNTLLQVVDRTGLTAKVKIISSIDPSISNISTPSISPTNIPTTNISTTDIPKVGSLVQELVRVLPRYLGLEVLLDRHLSRIERVDATSTFAGMRHISLGKTSGDYLFTALDQSYALSTIRGDLLPETRGQTGEAVKSAVGRLKEQLSSLLALKLLYLTDHQSPELLGLQLTKTKNKAIPRQYLLENTSDRPLWGMIFSHTPDPQLWLLPSLNPLLDDNPSFGIYELPPQTKVSIDLPTKFTTAYGIFSSQPFQQTITSIAELHPELTTAPIPQKLKLSQPLKIMEALYQDLQAPEANLNKFPVAFNVSDNYIFDPSTWATFWF